MDPTLTRRELLERLALLAGVAAIPAYRSHARTAPPQSHAEWRAQTFDRHEWDVVEAATARLVPTDDLPGAREANAVGYLDAQLAEPHFKVFRDEFEAGVTALDHLGTSRFAKRFLELTPEQQDEVLAALQAGDGSTRHFSADHFFQVLFTLTLEGLLGDPVHGGNRGEAGWQLVGFFPQGPRGHAHG